MARTITTRLATAAAAHEESAIVGVAALPRPADSVRLELETGHEIEAFVRVAPHGAKRPKCLLLHGNPGSWLDFERLVPALEGTADVAAIDLPGFGKSRRLGPGSELMSLERLSECAISAANALRWTEPVYLIGHSHGGGVAQVAAARYPDRVAGLVLIGTLGAPAHASYRLLSLPGAGLVARALGFLFRFQVLRPLNRALLRAIMSDIFSPERVAPEKLARELSSFTARPEILLSMVDATRGRPCSKLWEGAPGIRCPTLFLHGREDALVPARVARAIHERIVDAGGRSHFELVPGGHLLPYFQASELAARIIPHLR